MVLSSIEKLKKMRVLLIDDDQWIRSSLSYYFKKKTQEFQAVETAEDALSYLDNHPCDIVISDYKLPGMDGLTLLNRLKKDASPVLKILITAYTTEDVVARARDIGLDGFIKKPFNAHDIEELLERLMENPVLGN